MYPPTSWPYALLHALSTEVASCKITSYFFLKYCIFLIISPTIILLVWGKTTASPLQITSKILSFFSFGYGLDFFFFLIACHKYKPPFEKKQKSFVYKISSRWRSVSCWMWCCWVGFLKERWTRLLFCLLLNSASLFCQMYHFMVLLFKTWGSSWN